MTKTYYETPGKNVYFVIGFPGSGKTTVAHHIRSKIDGEVTMLDSFHLMTNDKKVRIILDKCTRSRFTGKKFIVTMHYRPTTRNFDIRNDDCITWVFAGIDTDNYHFLKSIGVRSEYLKRFVRAYRNVIRRNSKTRPFLLVTLLNRKIHCEIHRYHKIELVHVDEEKENKTN